MASPLETLGLAAASVAAAVGLAELYSRVGAATGLTAWVAAAGVNTVLAAVVLGVTAARRRSGGSSLGATPPAGTSPGATPPVPAVPAAVRHPAERAAAWLRCAAWRPYLPALAVLAGALFLATLSRIAGGAPVPAATALPLGWILWVPPVEELVFRAGIGALFRRVSPGIWAAWFSALTFALVHADPTLARLASGHVGLPLGPFLLGLACEALLAASGRLLPCIALHAACNATAAVFAAGDSRWLDWLGFLYT